MKGKLPGSPILRQVELTVRPKADPNNRPQLQVDRRCRATAVVFHRTSSAAQVQPGGQLEPHVGGKPKDLVLVDNVEGAVDGAKGQPAGPVQVNFVGQVGWVTAKRFQDVVTLNIKRNERTKKGARKVDIKTNGVREDVGLVRKPSAVSLKSIRGLIRRGGYRIFIRVRR